MKAHRPFGLAVDRLLRVGHAAQRLPQPLGVHLHGEPPEGVEPPGLRPLDVGGEGRLLPLKKNVMLNLK